MKKIPIILLLTLTLTRWAHAADKLEDVLTKMDAAAARFRGMTAQISKTTFVPVVDGRIIDVSYGAAQILGMSGTGVQRVRL